MKSKKDYVILMADIINSSNKDQNNLMKKFKSVIKAVNQIHTKKLLSPLTITLGDEFQGIVTDLEAAVDLIFYIEEEIIHEQGDFKLRYVLLEGAIDTPINENIAYGMLGDGLTRARAELEAQKISKNNYYIDLPNKEASAAMMNSLLLYQSILEDWNLPKDNRLISSFIKLKDYKLVAEALGKSRSQIWKRERNLKIEEYFAVKKVVSYIANSL